ncbi:MAG: transglycosylase SLT domain-containing protein, partial [Saprospiraceae bacterium]|nr:transglycosylase SLT domain-containing protein [Saprospiraceae bacterium]
REIAIHTDGDRAWAVRKDNPQLKAVLDEFVRKNRKGTLLGNLLFNRYMKNVDFVSNAFSSDDLQRFRDLRDYFIKYGDQYQLDWLLLAAQGYQESGLDQNKRSPAGAVGIMQIKPSTARDPNVNIPDIHRVESNIHAGTKYLRFL